MLAAEQETRFEFGENWRKFLKLLNQDRLRSAQQSLIQMLEMKDLKGRTFLDIGSGSGLFSLAARRLGARVHSFDYDPEAVACTAEVRDRYQPDDPDWTVERGSVLDADYLSKLGTFDVIYAWGVLHHTGDMWRALEEVIRLVKPGGKLFVAIYNDQGKASRRWLRVKRIYVALPPSLRFLVLWPTFFHLWWKRLLRDFLVLRPLRTWREYGQRGMSPWRDVVDWVGGYPFEVAKPEQVFRFCRDRGFTLEQLTTEGGDLGCNQFVFTKTAPSAPPRTGFFAVGASEGTGDRAKSLKEQEQRGITKPTVVRN